MTLWLALLISVILLIGNAWFVGAEFALISARRSALEPQAEAGSRRARTTIDAMEKVSLMLAGAQLGVTVCSLGLGALAEPAIADALTPLFHSLGLSDSVAHIIAFIIALALVVFVHVVLGEMVPKNISLAGPERAAMLLVPPLVVFVRIFKPLIWLLNAIANGCLRLVGVTPKTEIASAFTRDEVAALVEQSHREGVLEQDAHDRVVTVLTVEASPVHEAARDVATVLTVPEDVTPEEVEDVAGRTRTSRIPVRSHDGDISGYVHLKDMLAVPVSLRNQPIDPDLIRPMVTIAATEELRSALSEMAQTGSHLGRLHDANGEIMGIVALEDLVSALVGQMRQSSLT